MIKVLKKTFDIIEFIARQGGQPVLPSEIVKELKLNQATSIRILKDLVHLGYLEQISRQKGYVLGPTSFWVSGGKKYKDALSRKADPFVLACAKETGQYVALATNVGMRRVVLCYYNMNPRFNVDTDKPRYEDMYKTVTGHLLLAYMPEKEMDALVRNYGPPSPGEWEGVTTFAELKAHLKLIRKRGCSIFKNKDLFVVSFPVFRGKEFVAALGMPVLKVDCDAKGTAFYVERLRKTAKDITAEISFMTSIG